MQIILNNTVYYDSGVNLGRKVIIIRHGKSIANERNLVGLDLGLCDEGVKMTEEESKDDMYKDVPKDAALVVSSLLRTQQTARILFPDKAFIVDKAFDEVFFGEYYFNEAPEKMHHLTHGDRYDERGLKFASAIYKYLSENEITYVVSSETVTLAGILMLMGWDIHMQGKMSIENLGKTIVEI